MYYTKNICVFRKFLQIPRPSLSLNFPMAILIVWPDGKTVMVDDFYKFCFNNFKFTASKVISGSAVRWRGSNIKKHWFSVNSTRIFIENFVCDNAHYVAILLKCDKKRQQIVNKKSTWHHSLKQNAIISIHQFYLLLLLCFIFLWQSMCKATCTCNSFKIK